jgi:hypothetical protein
MTRAQISGQGFSPWFAPPTAGGELRVIPGGLASSEMWGPWAQTWLDQCGADTDHLTGRRWAPVKEAHLLVYIDIEVSWGPNKRDSRESELVKQRS